jgi:hypothetical protein
VGAGEGLAQVRGQCPAVPPGRVQSRGLTTTGATRGPLRVAMAPAGVGKRGWEEAELSDPPAQDFGR